MTIIIGAGPAGISAALELLKEGEQVTLIDRSVFPRNKVSSGIVTLKTYELLKDIPKDFYLSTINTVEIAMKGEPKVRVRTKYPFRIIDRKMVDNKYVEMYKKLGGKMVHGYTLSRVLQEEKVIELKTYENNIIRFSYENLVIACGCPKIEDIEERKSKGIALATQTHINNVYNKKDITLDLGYVKDGYSWQFPIDNELIVGTAGLDFNTSLFTRYLQLLNMDNLTCVPESAYVPYGYTDKSLVNIDRAKQHVYTVGDSANLVDPITGEGMYMAMRSGYYAARSIIENNTNIYCSAMDMLYERVKNGQRLRNLMFMFKNPTIKLLLSKPDFFSYICDEVISTYHLPYRARKIISAYKNNCN